MPTKATLRMLALLFLMASSLYDNVGLILSVRSDLDDDVVGKADDALPVEVDGSVGGTDAVGTAGLADAHLTVFDNDHVEGVAHAHLYSLVNVKRILAENLAVKMAYEEPKKFFNL